MSCPRIELSVLTCCYKYLQRLRVFLRSLASQDIPPGAIEVVITDPQSPDGLADFIETVKQAVPDMNVVRVEAPEERRRNRGWMIARAFERSRGATIMVADCDVVWPRHFARVMLSASRSNPERVLGVYRNLLGAHTTARILAGLIDPVERFNELLREDQQEKDGYRGVLGYCQVVPRSAMENTGYPEEFDNIAKSDIEFVERLRREQGIRPGFMDHERLLHLWHPRNWEGTEEFL